MWMHVELRSTKGCVFEKPFDSYDRKYYQLATVTTCTVCSARIRYSAETCRNQAKKVSWYLHPKIVSRPSKIHDCMGMIWTRKCMVTDTDNKA